MTELFAFLAGLAAGYLLACWRVSKRTGVPMRRVILGGPEVDGAGGPGEEGGK